MSLIARSSSGQFSTTGISVSVTTSAPTSGSVNVLDMREYAGGMVYVPSGSSITSLTFYVAPRTDGTFLTAYDDSSLSSAAQVVLTVAAGKAYPMPSCLYAAGAIGFKGDAAGTIYVTLKA
jgi:hypothetical protein